MMFLANVYLGRNLSKEDMGSFKLIMIIAMLVTNISLLGQNTNLVRFFCREGLDNYNWKSSFKTIFSISFLISLFLVPSIGFFYNINSNLIISIYLISFSLIGIELYSSIQLSKFRYHISTIFKESPRILFPILLITSIFFINLSIINVLILLALSYFVVFLVSITSFSTNNTISSKKVPPKVFYQGLYFLVLNFILSALMSFDMLIIGKILDRRELGVYWVVFNLMRGFELAFIALTRVYIPKFSHPDRFKITNSMFIVLIFSGLLSLLYLFAGKPVLHLLYEGKYDEGAYLISIFVFSGVMRLFYSIPLSLIQSRGKNISLGLLGVSGLITVLLSSLLCVFLTYKWGNAGAALSTIFAWTTISLLSLFIIWRHKLHV